MPRISCQWSSLLLRIASVSVLLVLQACASPPQRDVRPGAHADTQPDTHPAPSLVRQIDVQLRSDLLMDALADRFKPQWESLLAHLATLEMADQSDDELAADSARAIAGFRRELAPAVRLLVQQMPDALLHDFFTLRMQTYQWYGQHHPETCNAMVTGSVSVIRGSVGSASAYPHSFPQRVVRRLPAPLRRRHVVMTARVIRADANVLLTSAPAARPDAIQMSRHTPRNSCFTMAQRIGELLSLPTDQGVQRLRQILPRDTPPRYRAPAALRFTGAGQLFLNGPIGQGTASLFSAMLQSYPSVNQLVLNSPGGLLSEAIALADLVRTRGMDTLVINRCDSACTVVLVAGHKRLASANARVGFHRPALAGDPNQPSLLYRTGADYRRLYPASVVSDGFLARVSHTSSADIWYPTWTELLQNGVITGQYGLR